MSVDRAGDAGDDEVVDIIPSTPEAAQDDLHSQVYIHFPYSILLLTSHPDSRSRLHTHPTPFLS
jgi:hypothetical protein